MENTGLDILSTDEAVKGHQNPGAPEVAGTSEQGLAAPSLGIRDAFNAFHEQRFADRLAVSLLPKGPSFLERLERVDASIGRAGETVAKGVKDFFKHTKERGQNFSDTVRRSLAKNAVGQLVEIDASDGGTSPTSAPKKTPGVQPMVSSGLKPHAVVSRKADGSPKVEIIFPPRGGKSVLPAAPSELSAPLWPPKDPAEASFAPAPKKSLPEDIFRTPAAATMPGATPASTSKTEMAHIVDLEGAAYGTVPKFAGESVLAAWASAIRRTREENDSAEDQSALLEDFLEQMAKWGWNDAATNAAFDMFSDILYPGQAVVVNPAADLASAMRRYEAKRVAAEQGAPGKKAPRIVPVPQFKRDDPSGAGAVVPPVAAPGGTGGDDGRARTTKNVEPNGRGRVFLAGFVAGGLAVAALFGLAKCAGGSGTVESQPTPTPSVSATQTPGGGQTPGGEQTPGNPDDTDDGDDGEIPVQPQVQTRLKGAEVDKKGDFVRMTSYADRHKARENGEDFSTVWWIAREQLDAVNGAATPTVPEIWKFTDQTLDHNELTWDEARRLHKGQKIRLLSDAAAKQVIETVK